MSLITRITLMGTSGVGKTTLSTLLKNSGWYHYSGDYRIATHYLQEPINDWLKELVKHEPILANLLLKDAISIKGKVSIDHLHIVSAYIGKLGRDGYDLKTFIKRQELFAAAERGAMYDALDFILKAKELYGCDTFINDAGGSICEIDDDILFSTLAEKTLFVYIDTDEELFSELEARAMSYPKPICYHSEFLHKNIAEYSALKRGLIPDQFEADDFIRFITPKMMRHRRERYLKLAKRYGVILNAKEIWQIKRAKDFLVLLEKAYKEQRRL